jgi:puromycin-sensitive aminopeptidase
MAPNPYRLSNDVLPQAYRLVLDPDLDAARFEGKVAIDLEITAAVTEIVMNALDLEIGEAILHLADGTSLSCGVALDAETERVTFSPGIQIPPCEGTIEITFTGILNDLLVGFYRSTFIDPEGNERVIATTQMEATDARRAFPCFDEPAKKATFEISLVVADGLSAYSNSPEVEVEHLVDGRRLIHFAPTMVMSTYLVAFVVGPFEATEVVDVDGVPLRVIYPPGKADLAPFALEIGAFSLRYFTEYFKIPYPGDKVDLIAIPDFAFGAMENLGCITFRETALLVDPASASRLEVERVVDVVAHEMAHMWFGDLVTMGWWEGIWLNEAFATFMEIKCTDAFRPAWERWVTFGIEREAAMAVDGMHSTRPIEFEVVSPNDARGMFDVLTYQKGGSVLRMLEQYLGEETFRAGIHRYLMAHAFGNTVTADLWAALSEASGEDVAALMDTWILQGGHPLVRVEGGQVSQTPFAYGPSSGESAIGDHWKIPLLARPLGGGAVTSSILEGSQAIAPATLVNAGGVGTYRTTYGPDELVSVAAAINDLAPLERFTLLADTWAAVQSGYSQVADFLRLAKSLGPAIEPSVWSVVAGALSTTSRIVAETDRQALEAVARSLALPLLEILGMEAQAGEDEKAPTLRATALAISGVTGADATVRAWALEHFDADDMAGDLASATLSIVGAVGRPEDFATMRSRLKAANNPQLEDRYQLGLTTFGATPLALEMFEVCRNELRTQDAPYVVRSLLANRTAGPEVFDALCGAWAEVLARFPENAQSRMLSGISQMISSAEVAERVSLFLRSHPIATGMRSVEQDLERQSVGVALMQREQSRLGDALRSLAGE